MSDNMVTIASFDTVTHASLLRMRLEREGIACVLANEQYLGLGTGMATGSAGWVGIWLQVPKQDAERARQIANEMLPPEGTGAAEVDKEAEASLQCPACHSEDVEYQESDAGFEGNCAACGHRWKLA